MARTRSILVVGVAMAVVGLIGCRSQSDQAVRAGDGTSSAGQAPASSENPAVGTPSAQAPGGSFGAPTDPGIAQSVLILLGPAGLSVPGIGVQLGFVGPGGAAASPGGSTGSGGTGSGTGGGGQAGAGPATPGVPTGAGSGSASGNGTGGTGNGNANASNTAAGFCAPAKSLDSALAAVGKTREPAALRSAVARARSAFTLARAAATSALVGDVDVLANAYGQLFGGMEAAGYDLNRLSVGAFSPLLTPEVEASSGRLRDFVNNDC